MAHQVLTTRAVDHDLRREKGVAAGGRDDRGTTHQPPYVLRRGREFARTVAARRGVLLADPGGLEGPAG